MTKFWVKKEGDGDDEALGVILTEGSDVSDLLQAASAIIDMHCKPSELRLWLGETVLSNQAVLTTSSQVYTLRVKPAHSAPTICGFSQEALTRLLNHADLNRQAPELFTGYFFQGQSQCPRRLQKLGVQIDDDDERVRCTKCGRTIADHPDDATQRKLQRKRTRGDGDDSSSDENLAPIRLQRMTFEEGWTHQARFDTDIAECFGNRNYVALHLWGPSGAGKTSVVYDIERYCKQHNMPVVRVSMAGQDMQEWNAHLITLKNSNLAEREYKKQRNVVCRDLLQQFMPPGVKNAVLFLDEWQSAEDLCRGFSAAHGRQSQGWKRLVFAGLPPINFANSPVMAPATEMQNVLTLYVSGDSSQAVARALMIQALQPEQNALLPEVGEKLLRYCDGNLAATAYCADALRQDPGVDLLVVARSLSVALIKRNGLLQREVDQTTAEYLWAVLGAREVCLDDATLRRVASFGMIELRESEGADEKEKEEDESGRTMDEEEVGEGTEDTVVAESDSFPFIYDELGSIKKQRESKIENTSTPHRNVSVSPRRGFQLTLSTTAEADVEADTNIPKKQLVATAVAPYLHYLQAVAGRPSCGLVPCATSFEKLGLAWLCDRITGAFFWEKSEVTLKELFPNATMSDGVKESVISCGKPVSRRDDCLFSASGHTPLSDFQAAGSAERLSWADAAVALPGTLMAVQFKGYERKGCLSASTITNEYKKAGFCVCDSGQDPCTCQAETSRGDKVPVSTQRKNFNSQAIRKGDEEVVSELFVLITSKRLSADAVKCVEKTLSRCVVVHDTLGATEFLHPHTKLWIDWPQK